MVRSVEKTDAYAAWFATLKDKTHRGRINARIDRLVGGNPGDVAPIGKGASELRFFFGPGYRVYFIEEAGVVTLLLGGDKSTQSRDIARALDMLE